MLKMMPLVTLIIIPITFQRPEIPEAVKASRRGAPARVPSGLRPITASWAR
jgi:hypothetical protein